MLDVGLHSSHYPLEFKMSPENKSRIYSAIGAVAFIIGGLLARTSAIENAEKLEKMWKRNEEKVADPLAPPPPATVEETD